MTNKEAADIVRTFQEAMDTPITEYRDVLLGALDMAIEALEKERRSNWSNSVYKSRTKYTCTTIHGYKCDNCGMFTHHKERYCCCCGSLMENYL